MTEPWAPAGWETPTGLCSLLTRDPGRDLLPELPLDLTSKRRRTRRAHRVSPVNCFIQFVSSHKHPWLKVLRRPVESTQFRSVITSVTWRQRVAVLDERVGHCGDNAACEGFFGLLKRERVYRMKYATLDAARADVFEYIERFHNPRMPAKSCKAGVEVLNPFTTVRDFGVEPSAPTTARNSAAKRWWLGHMSMACNYG